MDMFVKIASLVKNSISFVCLQQKENSFIHPYNNARILVHKYNPIVTLCNFFLASSRIVGLSHLTLIILPPSLTYIPIEQVLDSSRLFLERKVCNTQPAAIALAPC